MLASGLHLPLSRICSAFVPIFQASNPPPTQWDHPSNDPSVCLSQISTSSAGLCHVWPQPPWLPPAATATDSSRQRHILPAWRSGPGPLCPKDIKGPWRTKEEEQLRSWKLLWNRLGCEVEVGTNWVLVVWKWWWVSCWVVLGGVCSWYGWMRVGVAAGCWMLLAIQAATASHFRQSGSMALSLQ